MQTTWPPVTTVPRILVLTPDPGIVFGLSFRLSSNLSIRSHVGDIDELLDPDLVVLDVTGARPDPRYAEFVGRLTRGGVRVVFLSDQPLALAPARVVQRPFKLKQLADEIRDALAEPLAVEDREDVDLGPLPPRSQRSPAEHDGRQADSPSGERPHHSSPPGRTDPTAQAAPGELPDAAVLADVEGRDALAPAKDDRSTPAATLEGREFDPPDPVTSPDARVPDADPSGEDERDTRGPVPSPEPGTSTEESRETTTEESPESSAKVRPETATDRDAPGRPPGEPDLAPAADPAGPETTPGGASASRRSPGEVPVALQRWLLRRARPSRDVPGGGGGRVAGKRPARGHRPIHRDGGTAPEADPEGTTSRGHDGTSPPAGPPRGSAEHGRDADGQRADQPDAAVDRQQPAATVRVDDPDLEVVIDLTETRGDDPDLEVVIDLTEARGDDPDLEVVIDPTDDGEAPPDAPAPAEPQAARHTEPSADSDAARAEAGPPDVVPRAADDEPAENTPRHDAAGDADAPPRVERATPKPQPDVDASSDAATPSQVDAPPAPEPLTTTTDAPPPQVVTVRSAADAAEGSTSPSLSERARAIWASRRSVPEAPVPSEMHQRFAAFAPATEEIERLVEELPLVRNLPALLRAITRSVAEELGADTVGLWRATSRGWMAEEHVGFTPLEASTPVAYDQPLLHEVDTNGGAMLIDPIDRLHAAVAGIGGAHTRSIMAAALAVGPSRYGMLTVGRDRPLVAADLDHLAELALEAAWSIAVAEHLERIGGLVRNGASSEPAPTDRMISHADGELLTPQRAGAASKHAEGGQPDQRPHDQHQ